MWRQEKTSKESCQEEKEVKFGKYFFCDILKV